MIARRWISTTRITPVNLSAFTNRKTGTGSGPFVEFPDFHLSQDSLILRMPSFSTVYGKLDQIKMFNAPPETLPPAVELVKLKTGFTRISTSDYPVNLVCDTIVPTNNVKLLEIDEYEKGWRLYNPETHVICYSGDVSFASGRLIGRGVVALMGQGPVFDLSLTAQEEILLTPESILGHEQSVQLHPQKLNSFVTVSEVIKQHGNSFLGRYYDKILGLLSNVISKEKVFYKVKGPGKVLIQTGLLTKPIYHYSKDMLIGSMK
ncbi:HBR319Cp [Eremothecium sinecaudum]|uniref:Altered inheritance of mitochondria protein 24, mitochondrial n=1 Tax=Eremothecium sinecaudum TaxID=45286 RepID=A0A109UXC3_9SACH|nr:HBR319Cp [Eremothecium sinecaudum]AMD19220.1 HBR319Cp [Eremothecium sinecaudum]